MRLPSLSPLNDCMREKVTIRPLADRPDVIPVLAELFHAEWHAYDGRSKTSIESQLRQNLSRDAVPITFIAETRLEMEMVGTVSLDVSDFPPLDRCWPWVASLYVIPKARGKGIGTLLMRHIQRFAMIRNFERLYLWTEKAVRLYEKCGWKVLRRANYNSHPVTVMQFVGSKHKPE
jgi:GNAT superfamily N-acetyltransferase